MLCKFHHHTENCCTPENLQIYFQTTVHRFTLFLGGDVRFGCLFDLIKTDSNLGAIADKLAYEGGDTLPFMADNFNGSYKCVYHQTVGDKVSYAVALLYVYFIRCID